MLWVLLALAGAVADAGYYVTTKKMLQTINPHVLAAGSFLFTSFFLFVLAFYSGIPAIGSKFLMAVAMTTALNVIATIFTYKALASTDISITMPMISFTPVFLIGTSFLFLHELPTLIGIIGILIIVFGSYILNLSPGQKSIADPIRSMFVHRGVLYMLFVAFLYAIAINFDKITVQESDPFFGSAVVFFVLGSAFVIIAAISRRTAGTLATGKEEMPGSGEQKLRSPAGHFGSIAGVFIFIGLILTVGAISINYAYSMQIVPYIISIKRMSIIFIVISGAIVFREPNIGQRLCGAGLMVIGAVIILLSL